MSIREFLLKFPRQPVEGSIQHPFKDITNKPLLDFVVGLQLRNRYKDNNGLFSATDVNLSRGRDLKDAKLGFELRDIVLEFNQCLDNILFNLIRGCLGCIGSADDLVVNVGHVGSKASPRRPSQYPNCKTVIQPISDIHSLLFTCKACISILEI